MSIVDVEGPKRGRADGDRIPSRVVDCDVHNSLPGPQALAPYLSERWRRHLDEFGLRTRAAVPFFITRPRRLAARADAFPPSGLPPGADFEFLRDELLDRWNIECAILGPIDQLRFGSQPPDYAAALTRALNEWTLDAWVDADPRLRASICVPLEDGVLAAAEIDRFGDDPRMVQVLLNMHTRDPLGHRRYWELYEAAAAKDLPIAVHVGGVGGNTVTGAGWPSYYLEFHASLAQSAQTQVISLICSGILERWPNLKFIFQEGGFAWVPSLGWRLDRTQRLYGAEVPELGRPLSEYLHRHFWFTTQPMEEPEHPDQLLEIVSHAGLGERLLFATDYPHWDFDAPDMALPRSIRGELRDRILSGNARLLHRLDPEGGA